MTSSRRHEPPYDTYNGMIIDHAKFSAFIYTTCTKRNSVCVCVSVLTLLKLLEVQASNLERLITIPW